MSIRVTRRSPVELLRDTPVSVCVVIGFPHGMTLPEVKAFEAQKAIAPRRGRTGHGGQRGGIDRRRLHDSRRLISEASVTFAGVPPLSARSRSRSILEASLLSDDQKVAGAILAKAAGAQYVKTIHRGSARAGATVEDVALLRRTVGDAMGVKAAGGIRDSQTALAMIEAGATRIGASRTEAHPRGGCPGSCSRLARRGETPL